VERGPRLLLTIDYDDSGGGEQGAQLGWRLDFDRLGHACGLVRGDVGLLLWKEARL
jgi:hypothetical protein